MRIALLAALGALASSLILALIYVGGTRLDVDWMMSVGRFSAVAVNLALIALLVYGVMWVGSRRRT